MGFFKDFKRDFAQAVNELMPDRDELGAEYDDEDMVNTFDENDNMDIAPEDMLESLDDFSIENFQNEQPRDDYEASNFEEENDDTLESEGQEELFNIPDAEVISDPEEEQMDTLSEEEEALPETELLVAEAMEEEPDADEASDVDASEEKTEDELISLDNLDEENMLENSEDALATETLQPEAVSEELQNVNLNQDVMEAFSKREEEHNSSGEDEELGYDMEANKMAEVEAKALEREQDIDSILADDTTYVTKGTTIKGDIDTDGGIDIIGAVQGNVSCGGKLIVGGTITGNVNAGEIYANAAKLEGEVTAEGSVKIGVGSVVVGNVSATSAVIAGAVNGDIDVHGPVIVDSTAVIMGNIKSRSVQINNGAVIEGFCSQCYSEIDVKSFFE